MSKKKNNDLRQLRQFSHTSTEYKKQRDSLIGDGIDEQIAEEMTKTKRKRKGGK